VIEIKESPVFHFMLEFVQGLVIRSGVGAGCFRSSERALEIGSGLPYRKWIGYVMLENRAILERNSVEAGSKGEITV
jgi:hypothetical protein